MKIFLLQIWVSQYFLLTYENYRSLIIIPLVVRWMIIFGDME